MSVRKLIIISKSSYAKNFFQKKVYIKSSHYLILNPPSGYEFIGDYLHMTEKPLMVWQMLHPVVQK